MALLWIEGFDQLGETADRPTSSDMQEKYGRTGGVDVYLAEGRYGGIAHRHWTNDSGPCTPFLTDDLTLITGFAYKHDAGDTGNTWSLISIRPENGDGDVASLRAIEIQRTPNNAIRATRISTVLGTSANNVLLDDTWHYIEVKVYYDSTNGTIEVRVDGSEVLSLSGVNSGYYSSQVNGSVAIWGYGRTGLWRYWDDWYVCDGTGNTCNDFLGPCRVLTKYPDSDGTGDFTANSGSVKHEMLTDSGATDTGNYCEISSTGNQLFGFEDVSSGNIIGIQVNSTQNCTGNKTYATRIIADDGNRAEGTVLPVYEGVLENWQIWELDPSGNAWTPATLNATQFGVESL